MLDARIIEGIGVSIISCWEVAKLVEYGRLKLPQDVGEWLGVAIAYPGLRLLQARSPQRVPVLFRYRVSGTVVLDGNPSQWKPVPLLTDWLSDNDHLNRLARREWEFGDVNLTAFVHCGFNSNRVHMTDDTLQP